MRFGACKLRISYSLLLNCNNNETGAEALSSGYGRRLTFKRLWVQIRILDGHFSHILL